MRAKGAIIQQFLLATALLVGVCWNLAHAGELRGIRIDTGATGTRAELRLDREVPYDLISLSSPERLVVDLPGVVLDKGLQLPAGSGLVQGVRSGHPVPGTTRIVFDLADSVAALKPHFENGADGARLVLEWPGDGRGPGVAPAIAALPPAAPAAPAPDPAGTSAAATSRLIASLPPAANRQPDPLAILTQGSGRVATGVPTRIATGRPAPMPPTAAPAEAPRTTQAPVKTVQDIARRAGMRPLVIAIDAGHGGQDPGARDPRRRHRLLHPPAAAGDAVCRPGRCRGRGRLRRRQSLTAKKGVEPPAWCPARLVIITAAIAWRRRNRRRTAVP
jgi:N-acetylmuramoyl-L-alanine amidase